MELVPVACFTCGKTLSHLQAPYEALLSSDPPTPIGEALDRLGVMRTCCRVRVMNPGKYAIEGIPIGSRQYRVQPPEVKTKDVLTGVSVGKESKILKPPEVRPLVQYRPKQVQPLPIQPLLTEMPPVQSLPIQSPPAEIPPQFQPVQEMVPRSKITVAPLNLQGINLQSLSDIAIPDVEYL